MRVGQHDPPDRLRTAPANSSPDHRETTGPAPYAHQPQVHALLHLLHLHLIPVQHKRQRDLRSSLVEPHREGCLIVGVQLLTNAFVVEEGPATDPRRPTLRRTVASADAVHVKINPRSTP